MNLDESDGKVWKFLLENFCEFLLSSLSKLIQADQNRLSTLLTNLKFLAVTTPVHKTDLGKREDCGIADGGDGEPAPPKEALNLQQKEQKAEESSVKMCMLIFHFGHKKLY